MMERDLHLGHTVQHCLSAANVAVHFDASNYLRHQLTGVPCDEDRRPRTTTSAARAPAPDPSLGAQSYSRCDAESVAFGWRI